MTLFLLIKGQIEGSDEYEKLINEKVSEQYCNDVITNLVTAIDELYIYSDFIKAPRQPEGYDNYIPKVDLVKELNAINKKDRYFYDFYRDIKGILGKTRDGHFSFDINLMSKFVDLEFYYFCIPFKYKVEEIFNEENILIDTYLTIESIFSCRSGYSNETLEKIDELEGKEIIKINNSYNKGIYNMIYNDEKITEDELNNNKEIQLKEIQKQFSEKKEILKNEFKNKINEINNSYNTLEQMKLNKKLIIEMKNKFIKIFNDKNMINKKGINFSLKDYTNIIKNQNINVGKLRNSSFTKK
jgi:hypothetical protein